MANKGKATKEMSYTHGNERCGIVLGKQGLAQR
jgi:hypothetical protein